MIPPIPVTDRERERRIRAYRSAASDNTDIDVRVLQGGPPLTDREYELFWATAFMILEAECAVAEGADGIVIDCTADPGFVEMTESLSVPVAGALRAGISRGMEMMETGGRFSIIALDEHWKRMITRQIRVSGYTDHLASIEVAGAPVYRPDHPNGLSTAESADVLDRLIRAGRAARKSGADAIVLGSTTIIDEVEPLWEVTGIPVIAPGIAALHQVEAALESGFVPDRQTFPEPVYRYGAILRKRLLKQTWRTDEQVF